jgi:hypothetical protein
VIFSVLPTTTVWATAAIYPSTCTARSNLTKSSAAKGANLEIK